MKKIGLKRNHKIITYHKRKRAKRLSVYIIVIFSLLVLIFATYLHLFVVFPNAEKVYLEKPPLETEIDEAHVAWVINELGAYNLHDVPLTNITPQFNIHLKDISQSFGIQIVENNVDIKTEVFAEPDIEINTDSETFASIYSSDDFNQAIIEGYYSGDLEVLMVKNSAALSLMGYGSIYESFKPNSTETVTP